MEVQGNKRRVLVVDDESTIRLTLAHILGAAGYDVATASSLGAAREALGRGHFPVVITELHLSNSGPMEGLDVLRHARQCCPKTGVIVMSADVTEELRQKVRFLGASHCHEKPYDIDEMLGSVRKITDEVVQ